MRDMKQNNYNIQGKVAQMAIAGAFKNPKEVPKKINRLKAKKGEQLKSVKEAVGENDFYPKGVRLPEMLEEKRQQMLLQEYSDSKDKRIENEIVETNLRLVVHIAKKFYGEDTKDLIQVGNIGLIKAIRTFKIEKNIKFGTYAARCIENEVGMHIRWLSKSKNVVYLQDIIATDNNGEELLLQDILENEHNNIDECLKNKEIKEKFIDILDRILNRLSYIEKIAILKDISGHRQNEIGEILQFSQSYMSRIIKEVRKKLCRPLNSIMPITKKYEIVDCKGGYRIRTKCEDPAIVSYIQKNYSIYTKTVESGYIDIFIVPDEMDVLADIIMSLESK